VRRSIQIKPGQLQLDLGKIDLPPTKWAAMLGHVAPELHIKAWKHGGPVTLADLRGKIVLLHFGGRYPSTSRDLPKLVNLHEDFKDHSLIIIGIYSCKSIQELEGRFAEVASKYAGVQDVPFLLGIDSAEPVSKEQGKTSLGATAAAYGITAWPTTLLIDQSGKLVESFSLYRGKERLEGMLNVRIKTKLAAWGKRFDEVYRLEEGQTVKRIAPPFIPERMEYYRQEHASQAEAIPEGPDRFAFHWRNGLLTNWGVSFGVNNLDLVLRHVLRLASFEYSGPAEILNLNVSGDWIIRDEASQKDKLNALETILKKDLGRSIRFEKRNVEREVIIAKGKFKFHPPSGAYTNNRVIVFSDKMAPHDRGGGGTGTMDKFLRQIGSLVGRYIINQAESSEDELVYDHRRSSYLRKLPEGPERSTKLDMLLANLSKQTSLTFTKERRKVNVWFIAEEK